VSFFGDLFGPLIQTQTQNPENAIAAPSTETSNANEILFQHFSKPHSIDIPH
jgi:hypothetical protein